MRQVRQKSNQAFPKPELSDVQEATIERMLGIFNVMIAEQLGDIHQKNERYRQ